MTALDTPLPQNQDAERDVLAAILISGSESVLARIRAIVEPQHFAAERNRLTFEAMLQEGCARGSIDVVALCERLLQNRNLERVGGKDFIYRLIDSRIPNIAGIEAEAEIVREKAKGRAAVIAASEALRSIAEGQPCAEVVAKLQAALSGLGLAEEKASRGIYDVVKEVHDAADQRAAAGKPAGILTGISGLDRATGGLPRQAVTILAAPSSHGKTTLGALNIPDNAVTENEDVRAVNYSLEMSRRAVADRLIARRSRVPLQRIREWKYLSEIERVTVDAARNELREINHRLFFADRIMNVSDLVADARKRKAEGGLDLIVVDYLQLLQGVAESTREQTVNQLAWTLVSLAKDLDVAVLALSQVTPAANLRSSGRLSIDDLRDSKAIGHHARIVLMLQRPWQSDKSRQDVARCHAVLQLEKNSEGDVGDITLHFDGSLQEFTEGGCPIHCYERKRTTGSAA